MINQSALFRKMSEEHSGEGNRPAVLPFSGLLIKLLFKLDRLRESPKAVEGTSVITGPLNFKKGPISNNIILDPSIIKVPVVAL